MSPWGVQHFFGITKVTVTMWMVLLVGTAVVSLPHTDGQATGPQTGVTSQNNAYNSVSCDFQSNLCGWSVVREYPLRWGVATVYGARVAALSVADEDRGDKGRLTTAWLTPRAGLSCALSFAYRIRRSNRCRLTVGQETEGDARERTLWTENVRSDMSDRFTVDVACDGTEKYRIFFEGELISGRRSACGWDFNNIEIADVVYNTTAPPTTVPVSPLTTVSAATTTTSRRTSADPAVSSSSTDSTPGMNQTAPHHAGSEGLEGGAIAGVIVGVLIIIVVIVVVVVVVLRRRYSGCGRMETWLTRCFKNEHEKSGGHENGTYSVANPGFLHDDDDDNDEQRPDHPYANVTLTNASTADTQVVHSESNHSGNGRSSNGHAGNSHLGKEHPGNGRPGNGHPGHGLAGSSHFGKDHPGNGHHDTSHHPGSKRARALGSEYELATVPVGLVDGKMFLRPPGDSSTDPDDAAEYYNPNDDSDHQPRSQTRSCKPSQSSSDVYSIAKVESPSSQPSPNKRGYHSKTPVDTSGVNSTLDSPRYHSKAENPSSKPSPNTRGYYSKAAVDTLSVNPSLDSPGNHSKALVELPSSKPSPNKRGNYSKATIESPNYCGHITADSPSIKLSHDSPGYYSQATADGADCCRQTTIDNPDDYNKATAESLDHYGLASATSPVYYNQATAESIDNYGLATTASSDYYSQATADSSDYYGLATTDSPSMEPLQDSGAFNNSQSREPSHGDRSELPLDENMEHSCEYYNQSPVDSDEGQAGLTETRQDTCEYYNQSTVDSDRSEHVGGQAGLTETSQDTCDYHNQSSVDNASHDLSLPPRLAEQCSGQTSDLSVNNTRIQHEEDREVVSQDHDVYSTPYYDVTYSDATAMPMTSVNSGSSQNGAATRTTTGVAGAKTLPFETETVTSLTDPAGAKHLKKKTDDPKTGRPMTTDAKTGRPAKAGDAKAGRPKTADAKTGRPKTAEGKSSSPKQGRTENRSEWGFSLW